MPRENLPYGNKLNRVNLEQFPNQTFQFWTHWLRRELHQFVGSELLNNHNWDQLAHHMKVEFTKFCYRAAANSMKIKSAIPLRLWKVCMCLFFCTNALRRWTKECPIINTRCLAMRLKKIFGKLAGAKEKQTESSARAPQQEKGKKIKWKATWIQKTNRGGGKIALAWLFVGLFLRRKK